MISDYIPFRPTRTRRGFPETRASEVSVAVVAELDVIRQLFNTLSVAATEHHVIGNECFLQSGNHAQHFILPAFFAELFQAGVAQFVFESSVVGVMKIAKL